LSETQFRRASEKSPADWVLRSELGTTIVDLADGGVRVLFGEGETMDLYRDKAACLRAEERNSLDRYK